MCAINILKLAAALCRRPLSVCVGPKSHKILPTGLPDLLPAFEATTTFTPPRCAIGCHGHWGMSKPEHSGIACHDGPVPATTRRSPGRHQDVKARVRRVIGELEAIEQLSDPIFAAPRDVYIDLDMAIHQLESAMSKMRAAWWP
jgi:hypothetical protein